MFFCGQLLYHTSYKFEVSKKSKLTGKRYI